MKKKGTLRYLFIVVLTITALLGAIGCLFLPFMHWTEIDVSLYGYEMISTRVVAVVFLAFTIVILIRRKTIPPVLIVLATVIFFLVAMPIQLLESDDLWMVKVSGMPHDSLKSSQGFIVQGLAFVLLIAAAVLRMRLPVPKNDTDDRIIDGN